MAADKPNIVFILAGDLGWCDTTLYGTTKFYQTPNLERLAKRGTLVTRAYSASIDPFQELYYKQFGGSPTAAALKRMNPNSSPGGQDAEAAPRQRKAKAAK